MRQKKLLMDLTCIDGGVENDSVASADGTGRSQLSLAREVTQSVGVGAASTAANDVHSLHAVSNS